jgi:hypothetical protein
MFAFHGFLIVLPALAKATKSQPELQVRYYEAGLNGCSVTLINSTSGVRSREVQTIPTRQTVLIVTYMALLAPLPACSSELDEACKSEICIIA